MQPEERTLAARVIASGMAENPIHLGSPELLMSYPDQNVSPLNGPDD